MIGRPVPLGVVAILVLAGPGAWTTPAPDYAWHFPADHWAHPDYRNEWWYFTGHLTPPGRAAPRFAYQFTVFRIGVVPAAPPLSSTWTASAIFMGHAALIDLDTGRHTFSEVLYRAGSVLAGFNPAPDPLVAWSRAPAGTDGRWTLRWNGTAFDLAMTDRTAGFALTLSTTPARPRVFQAPNGYSRKAASGPWASLYYSFPRLTTEGWVVRGRDTVRVTGQSWMDKEFGSNQLPPHQIGWDWYSLQLDDGTDIMLYVLRRADGSTDYRHATVVTPTGRVTFPPPERWSAQARGTWHSPSTNTTYPAGWTVRVAGRTLAIEPLVADQENVSALVPDLFYWEGAVVIREADRPVGRGFVELTGYGTASRPAI